MFKRNLANKLKGWNTISDISRKLNIQKSTAYFYVYILGKGNFIHQKIKKSRGTMYLIDQIPNLTNNHGMLENTEIVFSELEFSKNKIPPEQKIAYFLNKSKEEGNVRYKEQAKRIIRLIKNWKRLYKYLKAYEVIREFKKFYIESRKEIKKVPSMPKRYQKLIGV